MNHIITTCQNIVLDFDSTLVTIEGINELARKKGVLRKVDNLTTQAMNGEIPFEDIFEKRLALISPRKSDMEWLAEVYLQNITKGAVSFLHHLHLSGKNVFVISGGFDASLYGVTDLLQIPRKNIFANSLDFDILGRYTGFDKRVPLWKSHGKTQVIQALKEKMEGEWTCIGDGVTDFETAAVVKNFICFTGVVERAAVVEHAQYVCGKFEELIDIS